MKKLVLVLVSALSFTVHAEEKSNDNFKKTDEVLSEVVKKALVLAEKTGEFAIEQAPLLLQEFYRWNIARSLCGVFLGFLLIFIGYNARKIWGRKVKDRSEADYCEIYINGYVSEEVTTILSIILGVGSGLVFLGINIYNLIFILTAPKLYLIEYFIR